MHVPDWAYIILFIAGWIFLTQYLLPKFGVPT
jgi:hypothetical protein